MGSLKVGKINLNIPSVVVKVREIIDQLVKNPDVYYNLKFKPQFYFETIDKSPPSESGWYIILEGRHPLYVGKAVNLNVRLNSYNGSIDNFANKKRVFDPERNFIKKLNEVGIFQNLRVCIIREKSLCSALGMKSDEITELDRGNIEKMANIFRTQFGYT